MAVYPKANKEPMSGMTSGKEPRYKYTSPTIKPQPGLPKALGTDIDSYNMPIIDVQSARRNFPGYAEAQYYSLDDLRMGDTSGTTETDSVTGPLQQEGYTRINRKSGSKGRPTRRS